MSREKTRKRTGNRQFLAFLLMVAFLVSVLPSVWFARVVMAAEPIPETGNKVYHDNEYFELYHTVGGEVKEKKLEYLFAETIEPGTTRPVYCVMAGAPTPETGSVVPSAMNDPAAAALLGKIQCIIDMGSDRFEVPDTINGHPHIHYYVRQILIWHLVWLYQGNLGTEAQSYFKGIDINSFIDGAGSGPTAEKILAEAKRLWTVYDREGRPSLAGAYTPEYRAEIGNMSGPVFDKTTGKYRAYFTVTVRETHKGTTGGTFRFTEISGGRLNLRGSDGQYNIWTTTNAVLPSGSAFCVEGTWKEMEAVSSGKALKVQVKTVSNSGNENPQRMYGYFFDSSLTASGKTKQTYVGWHESSSKAYSGTGAGWTVQADYVELTKTSVFGELTIPEKGAAFEIHRSDYESFAKARADGFGFYGLSLSDGRIFDRETGKLLFLPFGTYTIRQLSTPEGTKMMSPNPATFTVDAKSSGKSATFKDEMKAGSFAIEKRIETGYDTYRGTSFSDLAAEEGAVFQVWNTNYSSYEQAPDYYRDLLTTDRQGHAESKILPYGEYRVHQIESEATKYTYVCDDETVQIRGTVEDGSKPETVLELRNRRYELKIQIRKVREDTGEIIPAAGVEFQILDDAGNLLTDWDGKDTFTTGADGTCNLEKLGLPTGTYFIRERKAPAGFVLSEEPVKIEVKKDESFIGVGPDGDMKAVPFADQEVSVTLELLKTGERLTAVDKTDTGYNGLAGYSFIYTQQALKEAEFELYCYEDVLGSSRDISLMDPEKYPEGTVVIAKDGKTFAPYKMFDTDGDGKKETPLKKGTLLGTYTTGADGRIRVEDLSLDAGSGSAKYAFVEVFAPAGFVRSGSPVVFEVKDDRKDQTLRVIRKSKSVNNERKKVELNLTKVGRDYAFDEAAGGYVPSETNLAGAVFGIYAGAPILSASGEVLVQKDALIEVVISGENGRIKAEGDYPSGGAFYAKELAAPEGYVLTADSYAFPVRETVVNERSRAFLKIEKTASDTGLPMKGVTFSLFTEDGQFLEELVTDENGTAVTSSEYPLGEKLILRETKTIEGYALLQDRIITICKMQESPGEKVIQTESVVNYRLSEVRVEKICGDGTSLPMDGVTFELWKKGDEGKTDVLLAEEKTDTDGRISFFLGEGEYYLVETDVGRWTNFRVMEEALSFSCGKEGKVQHFVVTDELTKAVTEKRSAGNGDLLGNCGISVRNGSGKILSFLWSEEKQGYVLCADGTEGATQVLYTGNETGTPGFGKVAVFGLSAGDYEIFEVEAPEGYRNDSEVMPVKVSNGSVLGVTRLYDTMKTSETDRILGFGACGICGISTVALLSIGYIELRSKYRRKRRK